MPKISSQNKVDGLPKNLSSGETKALLNGQPLEKKVKEYDFTSPKKFTKEQLKTLDRMHGNLSRALSSYFSGVLRVFCEINVLQIEEQRYYEYGNALSENALIGMMEMTPANENFDGATLILNMSPSIGFLMIDRLLGGSGEGYDFDRDFTDIEIAIMENIFKKIAKYMQDSWCNYIDVKIELGSIESNPRLVQAHSPEDIVVVVALNVKIMDLSGTITICIPAINLEEIIESFSSKYMRVAKKQDADKDAIRRQIILNSITNSDLEMKAVLHELQLDLQDILQLQVDDVIPLSKSISNDVQVKVEDMPWFEAKLGEIKMKKAIKISSMI